MDTTYTIESDNKEFYVKNNGYLGFIYNRLGWYQTTKKMESLTIKDLYSILADTRNKYLLDGLKITDNKGQNISFKIDSDGCDVILETDNKKEAFIFHKDGSMDRLTQIKSSGYYILDKFDKNNNLIENKSDYWENGDNLKTVLRKFSMKEA